MFIENESYWGWVNLKEFWTEQENMPYLEVKSRSFKVLLTPSMALWILMAFERGFIGYIIFAVIYGNIKVKIFLD